MFDVCPDTKWREYWGGDIVIVEFTVTDTASDLYRPKPGDLLIDKVRIFNSRSILRL